MSIAPGSILPTMNISLCAMPTVPILTFSLNLGCCATITVPNPPLRATVNSLLSLGEPSRRDEGRRDAEQGTGGERNKHDKHIGDGARRERPLVFSPDWGRTKITGSGDGKRQAFRYHTQRGQSTVRVSATFLWMSLKGEVCQSLLFTSNILPVLLVRSKRSMISPWKCLPASSLGFSDQMEQAKPRPSTCCWACLNQRWVRPGYWALIPAPRPTRFAPVAEHCLNLPDSTSA